MRRALLAWAAVAYVSSETVTLCRSAANCASASAEDVCGGDNEPLGRTDKARICVGFNARGEKASTGTKAMFKVTVDNFSTLSVDTLRELMGDNWETSQKSNYSEMWVGLKGKRTVGQRRGVLHSDGVCNSTTGVPPKKGERVCYGWALHNKHVIDENFRLSTGMTVIGVKLALPPRVVRRRGEDGWRQGMPKGVCGRTVQRRLPLRRHTPPASTPPPAQLTRPLASSPLAPPPSALLPLALLCCT